MINRLSDAFAPTPADFHERLERNLKEVTKMRKPHLRVGLLVAVLTLILALSGIAFAAARSGLIDALFPGQTPPPEAAALLTAQPISVSENGITLSIEESIHDGNTLSFSWAVESALNDPVLMTTGTEPRVQIGGEWARFLSGSGESLMYDLVLGGSVEGNPLAKRQYITQTYQIPEGMSAREATIEFSGERFYRILEPLKLAEISEKLANRGAFPVDKRGRTEPYNYPGVSGEDPYRALEQMGVIEEIGTLSLTKTIEPSDPARSRQTEPDGQSVFQGKDAALRVEEANFSAGSSTLIFTVTPDQAESVREAKENPEQHQYIYGNDEIGYRFALFTAGEDADGKPCLRYFDYGEPLSDVPAEIIIAPFQSAEAPSWDGSEDYNAYLKRNMAMEEAATIRIKLQ